MYTGSSELLRLQQISKEKFIDLIIQGMCLHMHASLHT